MEGSLLPATPRCRTPARSRRSQTHFWTKRLRSAIRMHGSHKCAGTLGSRIKRSWVVHRVLTRSAWNRTQRSKSHHRRSNGCYRMSLQTKCLTAHDRAGPFRHHPSLGRESWSATFRATARVRPMAFAPGFICEQVSECFRDRADLSSIGVHRENSRSLLGFPWGWQ